MLWILAVIILLYVGSHLLFKKNEVYIKIRKWVDIVTLIVTSLLIVVWYELSSFSFLFFIYFILSLGLIGYLLYRLKTVEIKKEKAEEVIKNLKTEEKVLEGEIDELKEKK